ncbi:glucosyltransferase [Gordonia phage GMA2]|uniref:Glycosyltransferase n=1 Tax=Gordonia phage GMA2 TaxID=1647283 RepID=A0A0K0N7C7_9CAUD|nr:glucosyltransferase [Gordonia phage GMA2]AKJ72561.1 hypothetical protein GMA2_23 [Gordonia phage GMA2]
MSVNYTVVGDTRRKSQALDLVEKLDASLALDSHGRWGPGINHLRAWVLGNTLKSDWIAVIEDDAILCDDFVEKVDKLLETAPTDVVSLYLGTGYPRHLVRSAQSAVELAESRGENWLTLHTLNHAVCVLVRQSRVNDMLSVILPRRHHAADEAISEWAQLRGIRISYPTVSLVDHRDEEPIISSSKRSDNEKRSLARRAFRFLG